METFKKILLENLAGLTKITGIVLENKDTIGAEYYESVEELVSATQKVLNNFDEECNPILCEGDRYNYEPGDKQCQLKVEYKKGEDHFCAKHAEIEIDNIIEEDYEPLRCSGCGSTDSEVYKFENGDKYCEDCTPSSKVACNGCNNVKPDMLVSDDDNGLYCKDCVRAGTKAELTKIC